MAQAHPYPDIAATAEPPAGRAIDAAQGALIAALAEGDRSGSTSALAELRQALCAAKRPVHQVAAALAAVDQLEVSLRTCRTIHAQAQLAA